MNSSSSSKMSSSSSKMSSSSADAALSQLTGSIIERNYILEEIAKKLGDPQTSQKKLLSQINNTLEEEYETIITLDHNKIPTTSNAPHGSYRPQLTPIGAKNHLYAIRLKGKSDKKNTRKYTNGLQKITVNLKNRRMYLPNTLIKNYQRTIIEEPEFENRFSPILLVSNKKKGTMQKKKADKAYKAHKKTLKNQNISQAKK
jgi:hypothetical protein